MVPGLCAGDVSYVQFVVSPDFAHVALYGSEQIVPGFGLLVVLPAHVGLLALLGGEH